jgi:hypothetical protein
MTQHVLEKLVNADDIDAALGGKLNNGLGRQGLLLGQFKISVQRVDFEPCSRHGVQVGRPQLPARICAAQ